MHWTKTHLLPIALERCNAREGEPAVVIGDTPRDVAVARAHGKRVVAVRTGPDYIQSELRASEPDVLLDDLSDTAAFMEACGL